MFKKISASLPMSKLAGFTMIELLIVITILGILAVAVLSAINPIEQINRGRDTGSQSDAEQMINAIERYNAFQGYFPWQEDANSTTTVASLTTITSAWADGGTPSCGVMAKLSVIVSGQDDPDCVGTQEIKLSFRDRLTDPSNRPLFAYNRGEPGDSTYICFEPQSNAFAEKAKERCGGSSDSLPQDLRDMYTSICPVDGSTRLYCLP